MVLSCREMCGHCEVIHFRWGRTVHSVAIFRVHCEGVGTTMLRLDRAHRRPVLIDGLTSAQPGATIGIRLFSTAVRMIIAPAAVA